jgi:hypothetical protein
MNAAMSTIRSGLTDFLNHISRQPFHPTLVDRYLSLAFELSADGRRDAMDHLNRVLMEPNPQLALLSNYHYMKHIRVADETDHEEEIFVLQLIQSCFRELGRYNQAVVVGEEISRLSANFHRSQENDQARTRAKDQRPVLVHKITLNVFDDETKGKQLAPFEQLGQELFSEFKKHLGSMPSIRHQKLAIEKLIHGLDALYQASGTQISQAIQTHGRNPLIWLQSGEFRPAVVAYFLECRVFQMGQDKLTTLRIRMVVEMLTAYYDQQTVGSGGSDEERDTRLRLLSEMIHIFLDAGVSFPSFVMGVS